MISEDDWNKLKAAEQYGMIAKLMKQLELHDKRIKVLEQEMLLLTIKK